MPFFRNYFDIGSFGYSLKVFDTVTNSTAFSNNKILDIIAFSRKNNHCTFGSSLLNRSKQKIQFMVR
jgi:hypothetical protein